jgi:thiol-disulfide isomerase/thioredoxin
LPVGASFAGPRLAAPDFSLPDLDGKPHTLSEYRGKVVVLNFWATWCPACKEELPSLQKLARSYRDRGLIVVAISDEPTFVIRSFVQAFGVVDDFVSLRDAKRSVFNSYRVVAIPTTYLIAKDGTKAGFPMVGARNWQAAEITTRLEALVAEKPEGGKR